MLCKPWKYTSTRGSSGKPTELKAIAEAAQKARSFEERGESERARNWRRIEAVLLEMRGPHRS